MVPSLQCPGQDQGLCLPSESSRLRPFDLERDRHPHGAVSQEDGKIFLFYQLQQSIELDVLSKLLILAGFIKK